RAAGSPASPFAPNRFGQEKALRGRLPSKTVASLGSRTHMRPSPTPTRTGPPQSRSGLRQRLFEIRPEIGEVLAAEAEADVVGLDAGGNLLGGLQLTVGGGGRMNGKDLGVADVGEVAEKLEVVDDAHGALVARLHPEAKQTAVAAGEVLVRRGVGFRLGQAGIVHPGHLGMLLEEMSGGEGVLADALHAQMQRLQADERLPGVEGGNAVPRVAEELQAH